MTAFIALLRAVNVGGTGKLPMAGLKSMCEDAGFEQVRTYIASGNVVFTSTLAEAAVRAALGRRLRAFAGKEIGVLVRTAQEMAGVVAQNPFRERPANRTVALFLDEAPPKDAADTTTGRKNETLAVGRREMDVHYPDGIGLSKLRIPAAKTAAGRNMNTVAKLAEMAEALQR